MEETTTESVDTQANAGADQAQPAKEPDTAVQETEETSNQSTEEAQPQTTGKVAETTEQTKEDTEDETAEVLDWAKKKGLPLSEEPTENELRLAKMQRDAENKMHDATVRQSELKNAITEEAQSGVDPNDDVQQLKTEVQVLRINQALNDFYDSNPDARDYDADMAQLVKENPAYASGGLEALYALAKHRKAVNEQDSIKKDGAREALESVALKQQAASPVGQATTKEMSSPKVTPELVRQKLQEGDKEWLRENREAIDQL